MNQTDHLLSKESIRKQILDLFANSCGNEIFMEGSKNPKKLVIFDRPLIGFAAAGDPIFATYKKPEAVGASFLLPQEWMPDAASVLSVFFPFTEQVRSAERGNTDRYPTAEWLHARIEGQEFLLAFMDRLRRWFCTQGVNACVPVLDQRFSWKKDYSVSEDGTDFQAGSNWSERHIAYACGLGTFGLSRGLITRAGTAGRFGSIILAFPVEPDDREYTGLYDYCTRCGSCARRCPSGAISTETGKRNEPCSIFIDELKEKFAPRYGCGKCQTNVPCESRIPSRTA